MNTTELFLASDAALRTVIDRISPDDFDKPLPAAWPHITNPTIQDILGSHAYAEAWVPAVIEGRPISHRS